MTIQVIGAGFGRTGTLSLKHALERLGYRRTHHMMEVFQHGDQVEHWSRIADGEAPDWDAVFADYQATTDFPACTYFRELAEHYPEARVVLTVRDEDRWYDSVSNTILAIWEVMPRWLLLIPRLRKLSRVADGVWSGVFSGRARDPEHAKSVYRAHNAAVQDAIPAERLLVFEVKQGWEPLCTFLDRPVPDEPFPNVNDTRTMRRRLAGIRLLKPLPYAILIGIALAMVW